MFVRYPWEACSFFWRGGVEEEYIWGKGRGGGRGTERILRWGCNL